MLTYFLEVKTLYAHCFRQRDQTDSTPCWLTEIAVVFVQNKTANKHWSIVVNHMYSGKAIGIKPTSPMQNSLQPFWLTLTKDI